MPMTTFRARHLLGIEHLSPAEITTVLDLADRYVDLNRRTVKQSDALAGLTQINMFFENSTRTQASFELAGKRLGADVMNMSVASSSVKKGETLIDTAMTLNAMHPDLLVVRHGASGAVNLLAQKVDCAVLNAGDGRHEHPTQALLDALTIRRAKGRIQRLTVAICGDIAHSRVARSNLILLNKMENRIRLIAPPTLMPAGPLADKKLRPGRPRQFTETSNVDKVVREKPDRQRRQKGEGRDGQRDGQRQARGLRWGDGAVAHGHWSEQHTPSAPAQDSAAGARAGRRTARPTKRTPALAGGCQRVAPPRGIEPRFED